MILYPHIRSVFFYSLLFEWHLNLDKKKKKWNALFPIEQLRECFFFVFFYSRVVCLTLLHPVRLEKAKKEEAIA